MTETPSEAKDPGFLKLAYRYSRALARWIKAGRPVRDEEEIKAIFTGFCVPCAELDRESNRCGICGCYVGEGDSPMMNKIAMQTENCPLGKW